MTIRRFPVGVLVGLCGGPAVAGEPPIEPFLREHCVRCHNAEESNGNFALDDLGPDMAARRSAYAAILERLRAGDMPPEDEPQPDPDAMGRVADWIHDALAASSTATTAAADAFSRPIDGNRLPHAILFGGPPGPSVPPPPRLWRLTPEAYFNGLFQSVIRAVPNSAHAPAGREIQSPFSLTTEPGFKDYAAAYAVDGGNVDILVRNSEKIAGWLTGHELIPADDRQDADWPGPDRPVSDEERAVLEEGVRVRLRCPHGAMAVVPEVAALLHPAIAPHGDEVTAAIRAMSRLTVAREPTPEEIEQLAALYARNVEASHDRPAATRMLLVGMLLAPEALHRYELGRGPEVRPGVRMLAPDEIALAVSLSFASNREPGVFAAARSGRLATRDDVAAHVRRILEDRSIEKPRVLGFFREYFGYDRAPDVFKDPLTDYEHDPRQLVADTDALVTLILERDREVLKELLTTTRSMVNARVERQDGKVVVVRGAGNPRRPGQKSAEAAYGFDSWPAEQPVELPADRIGILMQPSWLVAWSTNFHNDVVRRGRWVRERLLGGRVPDLPIDAAAVVPEDPHRTLRQRMEATRGEACWKCHRKMDDLGLPFEGFDHYGRPRAAETVVDHEATPQRDDGGKPVLHDVPLDTTGLVDASGDPALDGSVTGAAEMLRRLAASDRVRQVFIRHVFRYFLGRNETAGDAATLQEVDRAYVESGGSFKALLCSLLASEAFLYRTVPAASAGSR